MQPSWKKTKLGLAFGWGMAASGFPHPATAATTVYLHRCDPCEITASDQPSDPVADTSPLALSSAVLSDSSIGDAAWAELVACVGELVAAYDIDLVTADPGDTPHYEIMIGGHGEELNSDFQSATAVTEGDTYCEATTAGIGFVFSVSIAEFSPDPAIETCNSIGYVLGSFAGLSLSLEATDVMSADDPADPKEITDLDAQCGLFDPEPCVCTGEAMQNSHASFLAKYGARNGNPPPDDTPDASGSDSGCATTAPGSTRWLALGVVMMLMAGRSRSRRVPRTTHP